MIRTLAVLFVLHGHLGRSRRCPLNRGFTVLLKYAVRQKACIMGDLNGFKNLNAIERLHDGHIGVPKQ